MHIFSKKKRCENVDVNKLIFQWRLVRCFNDCFSNLNRFLSSILVLFVYTNEPMENGNVLSKHYISIYNLRQGQTKI
jgi:hypothetical protein